MGKKRGIRTLFWLSAGFAAGVYTAVLSMKLPLLPLLAGIAAAIGGLCGFFRDYRLRILSLSLLGAAAGLLLSYTQLSFTLLPAENLSGETLEVECRVIELPRVYESSASVEVRLCGENVPHVRCRLTLYGQELPEIGDELSATVRFSSARFRYGEESDTLTARGIAKAERFESDPKYADYCTMMVKTHLSLSHDPNLKGVPKNWRLPIRDILEYGGAKFLCPMAGSISMMPGTGSNPAYRRIDVDTSTGAVSGLF